VTQQNNQTEGVDMESREGESAPRSSHCYAKWFAAIEKEVERAVAKFPTWPDDPIHAAAVVFEEAGELQKATLEHMYEPHKSELMDVRDEAIQTAVMAIRFLASLHRYDFRRGDQHEQTA